MDILDWLKPAVTDDNTLEANAFRIECENFANLGAGDGRHTELNKLAFKAGTHVAQGHFTEYWATEQITAAAEDNGMTAKHGDREVTRVLKAGMDSGKESVPKEEPSNPLYSMVLRVSELGRLPASTWLVDDLILENSLTFVVGPPGVGKSFMTIDLAATLASKTQWHGRPLSGQHKTVYVAGEGISGWANRLKAWQRYHKTELQDDTIHFMPYGVTADSRMWDHLVDYVRDVKPGLIVLDTLGRTAGALEENNNTEMGKYIRACDLLREASGGTVLVLHHPNRADGTIRGASSLNGAADTVMYLNGDGDDLNLWISKNKEGRDHFSAGEFRLKPVVIGKRDDGKDIESAVFETSTVNPFKGER